MDRQAILLSPTTDLLSMSRDSFFIVMAGLDPAIQSRDHPWMAGSSSAMTE
jgi:hypothetical protein